MNRKQAMFLARERLAAADIDDASLEAEVLLRYVLGIDRTRLFTELEVALDAARETEFGALIERRLSGEPSAYITGHREFYRLDFSVDRNVLIPRPESELLVEKAIELAGERRINTIADIGTGCGAIAISLAVNLPEVRVYATDISGSALEVAAANCRKHGVIDRVTLLQGDLLQPLPEPVGIIIANLPYVLEKNIPKAGPVSFEPRLALNGGTDGLEKLRRLYSQVNDKLSPGGCVLTEIGQGQLKSITDLLTQLFPAGRIEVMNDLAGIERVVGLCLTQDG